MKSITEQEFYEVENKLNNIRNNKTLKNLVGNSVTVEQTDLKKVYYSKGSNWLLKNREGFFVDYNLAKLLGI